MFSGFSLRPQWQNVNSSRSQIRKVRCIEKNGLDIRGPGMKGAASVRAMSGPAAVARVTGCHGLSRIVIYCHKIITAPTFALVFVPRRIFGARASHLSRLRAPGIESRQLISHPGPRVTWVSPGHKHDQASPGSSEYNASPLIKTPLDKWLGYQSSDLKYSIIP